MMNIRIFDGIIMANTNVKNYVYIGSCTKNIRITYWAK